jgi:hypothetical protein
MKEFAMGHYCDKEANNRKDNNKINLALEAYKEDKNK